MTHQNARIDTPEKRQSLDEFQSQLEDKQKSTYAMHNAIIASAEQRNSTAAAHPSTPHHSFSDNLTHALMTRSSNMRTNLIKAHEHQATGADAARLSCLEQADANWKWFTWILNHQTQPPQSANEACATCDLDKKDQTSHTCPSCYDIEISTALLQQPEHTEMRSRPRHISHRDRQPKGSNQPQACNASV